jgi:hypothetical protein
MQQINYKDCDFENDHKVEYTGSDTVDILVEHGGTDTPVPLHTPSYEGTLTVPVEWKPIQITSSITAYSPIGDYSALRRVLKDPAIVEAGSKNAQQFVNEANKAGGFVDHTKNLKQAPVINGMVKGDLEALRKEKINYDNLLKEHPDFLERVASTLKNISATPQLSS